jgi:hypothetical protein
MRCCTPRSARVFAFCLLVGISALAVLTVGRAASQRRSMRDVGERLRQVYMRLQDLEPLVLGPAADRPGMFPASRSASGFTSSTAFWNYVITNRVFDDDLIQDLFEAPGVPPVTRSGGVDLLTAKSNPFCITADLQYDTAEYADVPFIFTRNLNITNLSQVSPGPLTDSSPFGKRGVVLVTCGGRVVILRGNDISNYFGRSQVSKTVLRP